MPAIERRSSLKMHLALLSAGSLAAGSSAAVITVDNDAPADFATIQAAVDAAASGDVVLVGSGLYARFEVVGKGLTIAFGPAATVAHFDPTQPTTGPLVRIANLPAASAVVLDGLNVQNFAGPMTAAIEIANCAGPVWIQHAFVDSYGAASLAVDAAGSVVLTDVVLQTNLMIAAQDGSPQAGAGALLAGGSLLRAAATTFRGSHGPFAFGPFPMPTAPTPGGHGLHITSGHARVEGGLLAGGSGSVLMVGGCLAGASGGAGLHVDAGAPAAGAQLLQSPAQGGGAGPAQAGCGVPPTMGTPIAAPAGAVSILGGTMRRVKLPGSAEQGDDVTLQLSGVGGDLALLFTAARPVASYSVAGIGLEIEPTSLLLLAALPLAGSQFTATVEAPPLPPGAVLQVPLQGVFIDAQGAAHSSAPAHIVLR